jgi:hypothetical protein
MPAPATLGSDAPKANAATVPMKIMVLPIELFATLNLLIRVNRPPRLGESRVTLISSIKLRFAIDPRLDIRPLFPEAQKRAPRLNGGRGAKRGGHLWGRGLRARVDSKPETCALANDVRATES